MEEKQIHQKNFLNTFEAADLLGVSPATLRTWRATDRGGRGSTSATARCSTRSRTLRRGFPSITGWLSRRTKGVQI